MSSDLRALPIAEPTIQPINSMLVEMMAAIARKDCEQRRERQAQGIQKARAAGQWMRGAQAGKGIAGRRPRPPRCSAAR